MRVLPVGMLVLALLGACSAPGDPSDPTRAASPASAVTAAPAISTLAATPPASTAVATVSPTPTSSERVVGPPPGGIFDVRPGDYDGAATFGALIDATHARVTILGANPTFGGTTVIVRSDSTTTFADKSWRSLGDSKAVAGDVVALGWKGASLAADGSYLLSDWSSPQH